jgi:thiamine biosynthesis lipoprotein
MPVSHPSQVRQIDASQLSSHMAPRVEHLDRFECFGGRCTVIVTGDDRAAAAAVRVARARLLEWHVQFSRFIEDSELSVVNRDPRSLVPVTPLMARLVDAAVRAASLTGGLVDPTLAAEIERAGYARHFEGDGVPLRDALALAPPRAPARPRASAAWRSVVVDVGAGTVSRPPGLRFDPGGIAKGLFADELAGELAAHAAVVVDCAGDLRLGGSRAITRSVNVESPFDGSLLHAYGLSAGGVATSGIGKRSWMVAGRPAHHLLDPATGRPAFSGIVQATALAPTAAEAEARSKAALLSGPEEGPGWLPHGGVIVLEDGSHRVIG